MATPTVEFHQEGDFVDYTPSSADVSAGDVVVQSNLVGVATADIDYDTSQKGSLRIRGIVKGPKTSGTSTSIDAGDLVYWDATNSVFTETAESNTAAGVAAETAADSATTIKVFLMPGVHATV